MSSHHACRSAIGLTEHFLTTKCWTICGWLLKSGPFGWPVAFPRFRPGPAGVHVRYL
ncbi:hypothetical protein B565_0117 [Aeromonas veronii B565]|nr:hypothetical protein B565_0117 [Aeromonas veronii B565]